MFQEDRDRSTCGTLFANSTEETERSKREPVRHMLFGSAEGIRLIIQELHRRQYAEPNDWSQPVPTGKTGEVMVILTKIVIR